MRTFFTTTNISFAQMQKDPSHISPKIDRLYMIRCRNQLEDASPMTLMVLGIGYLDRA